MRMTSKNTSGDKSDIYEDGTKSVAIERMFSSIGVNVWVMLFARSVRVLSVCVCEHSRETHSTTHDEASERNAHNHETHGRDDRKPK